ncbi:MAG: AEC family transporter [Lactobacillaceae bacterium]|jgi:predicted permease|nr:AEC family transporter [Lactobacillaceae bacterium]
MYNQLIMNSIISALSFVVTIFLAYWFKKLGILKTEDGFTLSKIVLNITLPATLLSAVREFKLDSVFFTFIILGIILNIFFITIALYTTRKKVDTTRAFSVYTMSGYNIGNFAIPFVASVFPAAVPFIGIFDIGNAIMVTGPTTIILDKAIAKKGQAPRFRDTFLKLIKSPPFVSYLICIILAAFSLHLPTFLNTPLAFLSEANSFLSMFVIGLFLKFNIKKGYIRLAMQVLGYRYFFNTIIAILCWFFLPFAIEFRFALLFALLSPVGNLGVMQATEFGSDEGKVGLTSSISIFISLIIMCALLFFNH